MKALHPRLVAVAALVGLGLAAAVSRAAAQVQMKAGDETETLKPKDPNTPQVLVGTFRMPSGGKPGDAKLGFDLADQLRDKLRGIASDKDIFVVPLTVINTDLKLAGYKPDSAVQTNELLILAGVLGAAETIDGTVTRLPSGMVEFTATFYRKNNASVSEPFAPVDGKDAGDVAKKFALVYQAMRKELPFYQKCESGLYGTRYDEAAAAARATIAAYPSSSIGPLCLISAFGMGKSCPTRLSVSVSRSSATIRRARSGWATSRMYLAKGDQAKAAEYAVKIYNLNPLSKDDAQSAINALVNSGAPQSALPIVNSLILADPANKVFTLQKLHLQLQLHQYKDAYQTADQLVKIDPSAATVDFFRQMIGAAQSDSNATMKMQYLAQATQKFPAEAELQLAYATDLSRAGKTVEALAAAKHAVEADPKINGGMVTVVFLSVKADDNESAFSYAKRALAAGGDSATIGAALLSTVGPLFKKANDTLRTREDTLQRRDRWMAVIGAAQRLDSLVPSPAAKFFWAFGAGNVALQALIHASELSQVVPPDKGAICAEIATVEAMSDMAYAGMRAGGAKYNQDGAVNLMKNISDNAQLPGQLKTKFCK